MDRKKLSAQIILSIFFFIKILYVKIICFHRQSYKKSCKTKLGWLQHHLLGQKVGRSREIPSKNSDHTRTYTNQKLDQNHNMMKLASRGV
jgi:hypothetical protein